MAPYPFAGTVAGFLEDCVLCLPDREPPEPVLFLRGISFIVETASNLDALFKRQMRAASGSKPKMASLSWS